MKKIKRIVMYILIFFPVSRGFSVKRAKLWMRKMYRNLRRDKNHTLKEKIWAYRHGYLPEYVNIFNITDENVDNFISERDYFYLQPINGIYRKWLANKVIARKVFSPFKENLQELYYQISVKNENLFVYPLDDCINKKSGKQGLIDLIKEKGDVTVTSPVRKKSVHLSYRNGVYYFGEKNIYEENELLENIVDFSSRAVIAEYIHIAEGFDNSYNDFGNTVRLFIANDKGRMPVICEAYLTSEAAYITDDDAEKFIAEFYERPYLSEEHSNSDIILEEDDEEEPEVRTRYLRGIISTIDIDTGEYDGGKMKIGRDVFDVFVNYRTGKRLKGCIPGWQNIKETIEDMGLHVPQLAFFAIDIAITENGFKCIKFTNVPTYPRRYTYREETVEFLKKKLREKEDLYSGFDKRIKRGTKRIKLKTRRMFAKLFFPAGLKPYLSVRWIKEVTLDLFTNRDVKLGTKLWAYRHGFLSYRIPQYGITKENHLDYISDFEYKWLRHINGRYRVLFEDKITIKYIINDFKECFPEYYYHIKTDNKENIIIPMMDCPDKRGRSFEDIFKLAREKGVLALKPDEGSHGDGFYKLSYTDGKYYLNFDEATEEDVLDILKNPDNQYLVTEYINNHPQFKKIYDGAVNTIRMIVFKMDGKTPEIGNAYMRFGSKATGAVDNMGAGGMFVQVDIETGKYGNAKIITHNSIQDCPYHPDSGVLIEGTIPHWEQIKKTILDVASSIRQMEYFGFDIAVTEDGIKFPEINRFPDYPKIEQLSPATMKYLLNKLEQKKQRYGYDLKPCRKLVHLPKR